MTIAQEGFEAAPLTARLRPDDVQEFRFAQLLLLLAEAGRSRVDLDLHRLAVTDFACTNPMLILDPDDVPYRTLRLAGFTDHPITHAAPGQRYVTRRERLVRDLTRLVSYGLVRAHASSGRRVFHTSERGTVFADALASVYADAYRASARMMLPRIKRLSDAALQRELSQWLRADPVLFDLLDFDADDLDGVPQ